MQAKSSQKQLRLAEAQLEILVPIYGIMSSQLNTHYKKRYLSTDATVSKDLLVMETTRRKCSKVLLS